MAEEAEAGGVLPLRKTAHPASWDPFFFFFFFFFCAAAAAAAAAVVQQVARSVLPLAAIVVLQSWSHIPPKRRNAVEWNAGKKACPFGFGRAVVVGITITTTVRIIPQIMSSIAGCSHGGLFFVVFFAVLLLVVAGAGVAANRRRC
jgi:hypothetical protein